MAQFLGEVQDARIFFNHHIRDVNPYRDTWTLWQGYAQLGKSNEGWVDGLADREVLTFGDDRVIGPSNWLNVGRTFDVARLNIDQANPTGVSATSPESKLNFATKMVASSVSPTSREKSVTVSRMWFIRASADMV